MKFVPLQLEGAFEILQEPRGDERGFFARAYCHDEFSQHGLETTYVQANNSLSRDVHTLRGLHYQLGKHAEAKIIRVVHGEVFDVLVDLRPTSRTFLQHVTLHISADKRNAIYVPRGFANGVLTLAPNTELFYLVSNFYCQPHERGLRWNDPALAIQWPHEPAIISSKDSSHPDFDPAYHLPQASTR